MIIIPSILTDIPGEVISTLDKLSEVILPQGFPLDRVQIDINDGTFLGVKTIEPQILSGIVTKLMIDYHLMTQEPEQWIDRCIKGKADRIIGQVEKMINPIGFAENITGAGIKAGLAFDIETGEDRVDGSVLEKIDVVLLMGYHAGKGGQLMDERVIQKIRNMVEIRERGNFRFKICVDGGIGTDNIKRVKMTGADEVIVGKRLTVGDIEENLEKLYKALY